jgi:hypothetical protein
VCRLLQATLGEHPPAGARIRCAAARTYTLIANVSNTPTDVIVRLLFEDGTPAMGRLFTNIPPNSRFNIAVQKEFGPEFIAEPFAARDKRFSAIVESVGTRQRSW